MAKLQRWAAVRKWYNKPLTVYYQAEVRECTVKAFWLSIYGKDLRRLYRRRFVCANQTAKNEQGLAYDPEVWAKVQADCRKFCEKFQVKT